MSDENVESEKPKIRSVYKLIPGMLKQLIRRRDGHERLIHPPFNSLRLLVPGFFGGDLVVIAGRPSMGKTAFAVCMSLSFVRDGNCVLVFSLEMSAQQILGRIMSVYTGIEPSKIQSGRMTEEEYETLWQAREENADTLSRLFILDSSFVSAESFTQAVDSWVATHEAPLGAVVVDYLQLMSTGGGSDHRERDVAHCSATCKRVGRQHNVPVFLLSQLNRGVELRANKRPMLSDLRESGAIEQDADIVLFLYRAEYYGAQDAVEGETEIIVSKHRNGPTGVARVFFNKERAMFYDDTQ